MDGVTVDRRALFVHAHPDDERQLCMTVDPPLEDRGAGHPNACHYAEPVSVL